MPCFIQSCFIYIPLGMILESQYIHIVKVKLNGAINKKVCKLFQFAQVVLLPFSVPVMVKCSTYLFITVKKFQALKLTVVRKTKGSALGIGVQSSFSRQLFFFGPSSSTYFPVCKSNKGKME